MSKKIFIIGANSDIGCETVKNIEEINELFLFSTSKEFRVLEKYKDVVANVKEVIMYETFNDINSILQIISTYTKKDDEVIIIYSLGFMSNADGCCANNHASLLINQINFLMPAQITQSVNYDYLNRDVNKPKSVHYVFIGSVSSMRGKLSTLNYSASKAALEVFAEGMNCISELDNGVKVYTTLAKPGFVKSKMLTKQTPSFLTVSSEIAGKIIAKAIVNGEFKVYTQTIWKLLIPIFKVLPTFIWKKIK